AVGLPAAAGKRLSGLFGRCCDGVDVGHERAQTGSGPSALVMVRSTAGLTVVTSDAVLVTPVFLTLPVTVAVLKIDEPADWITVPTIVIVMVPPESRDRTVHVTCGAL